MRQQVVDPRGGVRLYADEHAGEAVDRVHGVRFASRDERVEASEVLPRLVRAGEEEVLATERESPSILPIKMNSRWCTTVGTRSSARQFRSRTANVVEEMR